MHVQVVTYRIGEVSDADFIEANREFATLMSAVPGLLAKIWLKGRDGIYGGIYLWQDREAYESFIASELWASVEGDDSLAQLHSQEFETMADLSRATQPGLSVFGPGS